MGSTSVCPTDRNCDRFCEQRPWTSSRPGAPQAAPPVGHAETDSGTGERRSSIGVSLSRAPGSAVLSGMHELCKATSGVTSSSTCSFPSHLSRLRKALEGCDTDEEVMLALRTVALDIQPDLVTITKLMARYAKTGNSDRALAVYKSLHTLNFEPDVTVSNSALWACVRSGNAAYAWHVYSTMLRRGITPDSISYKALLTCTANAEQWRRCIECYLAAVVDGVRVDGACTMAILFALKRAGKWRIAEALLFCVLSAVPSFSRIATDVCGELDASEDGAWCQRLHSLRLECAADNLDGNGILSTAHGSSAGSAVTGLPNQAWLAGAESASKLLQTLDPTVMQRRLCLPDLSSDPLARACCNAVLQTYMDIAAPPSKSLLLLIAMSECKLQHVAADVVSYNLVIAASCKSGNIAKARGVYDALVQAQLKPNIATFLPLLDAADRAGCDETVFIFWNELKAAEVRPDLACCTSFINAAIRSGRAGELREAASWLHAIIRSHAMLPPSTKMIDVLLVALARAALIEETICIVKAAASSGMPLHSSTMAVCINYTAHFSTWRGTWGVYQAAVRAGYVNFQLVQTCDAALRDAVATSVLSVAEKAEVKSKLQQVDALLRQLDRRGALLDDRRVH